MALTRQSSKYKLTEEELSYVRAHILDSKLQHRAIAYANISYAKFRNIIDHGSGMSKEQHKRLMEFCKGALSDKTDH